MSDVFKFIKVIVPTKFWKRKNLILQKNKYLTIEEVIKRYEELSSI